MYVYMYMYIYVYMYIYIYIYIGLIQPDIYAATHRACPRSLQTPVAFTRYCHHQYCMVYGIQKGSR